MTPSKSKGMFRAMNVEVCGECYGQGEIRVHQPVPYEQRLFVGADAVSASFRVETRHQCERCRGRGVVPLKPLTGARFATTRAWGDRLDRECADDRPRRPEPRPNRVLKH